MKPRLRLAPAPKAAPRVYPATPRLPRFDPDATDAATLRRMTAITCRSGVTARLSLFGQLRALLALLIGRNA